MIVQEPTVQGGIAAVTNGYRDSRLEEDFEIAYVESYRNGNLAQIILKALQAYLAYIRVLLFFHPRLVHIHSSFNGSFYRKIPFILLSKLAGVPIINHIHGAEFEPFYLKAPRLKRWLVKKIYGCCDILIALSPEWNQNLSQIVPPKKIAVIKNYSVMHGDALQQRQQRPINNVVLFLGELGHRKGCFDIPYVIAEVKKTIPNVLFILAGAGSHKDMQALQEKCAEIGVSQNVLFPGWVRGEEKDDLLRRADVFFLPSYHEGMPMSILDAMGYGLPIVSTNVGGIPKLVQSGVNGECCEPGNIQLFVQGIVSLLTDSNARSLAAHASYDIVRNGYSLEKHIVELESIYWQLITED